MGSVVQLMELQELQEAAWPIKFGDGKMPVYWPEFEIEHFTVKTVDGKLPALEFKREDVDFERNGQPVQIGTIFLEYFPMVDCPSKEGVFKANQRIEFGRDDVVMMKWDGDSSRVDTITRAVKITARQSVLTMATSEYRRVDFEGVLAWAATGTGEVNGQEATLRLIYMPQSNGLLRMAKVQAIGFPAEMPLAGITFTIDQSA
jgi:hypothetical protein